MPDAAITQLAIALERGQVASLHLISEHPDRLVGELVEAGAEPLAAMCANDAGGLVWRSGAVRLGPHRTLVLVTSPMVKFDRAPGPAAEFDLGGEAGGA